MLSAHKAGAAAQVLFLLYHYFNAREIYNAIRVFIAGYVWMTGFGNFSYYYKSKDFCLGRCAPAGVAHPRPPARGPCPARPWRSHAGCGAPQATLARSRQVQRSSSASAPRLADGGAVWGGGRACSLCLERDREGFFVGGHPRRCAGRRFHAGGDTGARGAARRFMAMMWRLNFLVAVTCVALQNSYMLYYICPMHTLFTIMVYAALGIGARYNQSHTGVFLKCARAPMRLP